MTDGALGSLSVGVATFSKWKKKKSSCAMCLILYNYDAALNEIFF